MGKAKAKKEAVKGTAKMLNKEEWPAKFFGKFKYFGDGLQYQKKISHGG